MLEDAFAVKQTLLEELAGTVFEELIAVRSTDGPHCGSEEPPAGDTQEI
jgi:hypothetical protein